MKLLNNLTLCWDSEQRRRHDLFVSRIVGVLVYYGVVFVTWTHYASLIFDEPLITLIKLSMETYQLQRNVSARELYLTATTLGKFRCRSGRATARKVLKKASMTSRAGVRRFIQPL
jgi:hypothetical protein